jgi:hypothetical protein
VYEDQLGLNTKERINAEKKYIKEHGIFKFKEFTNNRKVDHFEKTKVYDVSQVVQLNNRSKNKSEFLPEQMELKELIDGFIKYSIQNNPKLQIFNQKYEKEVNKHFEAIKLTLDPENKTQYIPKTVTAQKEARLKEMHYYLGNKVLKLVDDTNKVKAKFPNSHAISKQCHKLTSELRNYLAKAFKEYFDHKHEHASSAIANDVKAALRNEAIRSQKELAIKHGYE